jgi:1-acyl-sn-glycerol-3-phosphate acyltransferase
MASRIQLWLLLLSAVVLVGVKALRRLPLRCVATQARLRIPRLCRGAQQLSMVSKRCDDYASNILSRPRRWGGLIVGPLLRYANSLAVGLIFGFILGLLNKFSVQRVKVLLDLVFHRARGRPLLTVSNHQSVLDDPGLWAVLLPYWRFRPEQMRWQICTEDVFFASKYLQPVIGAGNCMPLDRTGSLDQPLFQRFFEKLVGGAWCHIFPEGRVFQNWRFAPDKARLGPFKIGVGKLIAHCPPGKEPVVLPMYHTGMDGIVPEVVLSQRGIGLGPRGPKKNRPSRPRSAKPQLGQNIRYFVGEPLDFTDKIRAFRDKHPGMLDSWHCHTEANIELYAEITGEIRERMLALELEAWGPMSGDSRQATTTPKVL